MRTAAVLPVKSFGAAKQRLSDVLGAGSRHALAQAMFADVLAALQRSDRTEAVYVVSSEPAVALAAGDGVAVVPDPEENGQSPAALRGVRDAVAAGFERVLLVPGDAPMLDAGELDELLERSEAEGVGVVIVPDRHGTGTNALLLAPPDALEPRFGPGSLERHKRAATESGLEWRVEELASLVHDVDTPDDLARLAELLEASRGVAPRTQGALRQLSRSQPQAVAGL